MFRNEPSVPAIAEKLTVFLEAWVHQVLHNREVYVSDLFERTKLFGIAVQKSRHPELNDYVASLLESLKPGIASGDICKLAVVIFDRSDRPVERFVAAINVSQSEAAQFGEAALDRALKDCLLKLQFSDSALGPPPNGSRFELVAYSSAPDAAAAHLWVEEPPQPGFELPRPEVIPIKSTHLPGGALSLQLFAEACIDYRC